MDKAQEASAPPPPNAGYPEAPPPYPGINSGPYPQAPGPIQGNNCRDIRILGILLNSQI